LLLTELLNAVEGVERSLQAMQTAAVAAQAKADDYTAQFSPRDPEPVHGSHLSDPVVADVWDKFINMIVWARAVEGRVQRRGEGGDPGRHIASSGDPSSWSWTMSRTREAVAAIVDYSGVDQTTPVDVYADSQPGTTATKDHVVPTITTTVPNDVVLALSGLSKVTDATPPPA
jgi:hypothetical protein